MVKILASILEFDKQEKMKGKHHFKQEKSRFL